MSVEELRKIAKEEASKFIMENLNSVIIFTYIQNLEKEIENLKEINKGHQKLNGELREEIEELKKDNNYQCEERCRLTFELQETEDRLSKIELQLLEEE